MTRFPSAWIREPHGPVAALKEEMSRPSRPSAKNRTKKCGGAASLVFAAASARSIIAGHLRYQRPFHFDLPQQQLIEDRGCTPQLVPPRWALFNPLWMCAHGGDRLEQNRRLFGTTEEAVRLEGYRHLQIRRARPTSCVPEASRPPAARMRRGSHPFLAGAAGGGIGTIISNQSGCPRHKGGDCQRSPGRPAVDR